MIYTVTLNPSIDYIVRLKSFTKGITNRTVSEEYYIGGKGINVSSVLSELGIKSTAFGFVAGFTGEAIIKGLDEMGINADFITLKEGVSRINVKIKAAEESEINCQGPHISEEEFAQLLEKTDMIQDGDTIVLAGSIPKTLGSDAYVRILSRLKGRNVRIVVDATKKLLTECLRYKPFLIKPNKQELSEIFMKEMNSEKDIIDCASELRKMGARNVVVSLGSEGALLIDEQGKQHRTGIVKEKIVNTVGSGDSMVAGFIAGYERSGSYEEALLLGTACGNATAFSPGLAKKEKIIEMLGKLREMNGAS